jgi:hypothetical protein
VWDGRANVEEVELNSPTGPIETIFHHHRRPWQPQKASAQSRNSIQYP